MKKFKTREIDYAGCNPDVEETLKQGLGILCNVTGMKDPVYIARYNVDSDKPYTSYGGYHYAGATPVEIVWYVKKASVVVKWLEDNEYVPDEDGHWVRYGYKAFTAKMFKYCGRPASSCYDWINEWLEER